MKKQTKYNLLPGHGYLAVAGYGDPKADRFHENRESGYGARDEAATSAGEVASSPRRKAA